METNNFVASTKRCMNHGGGNAKQSCNTHNCLEGGMRLQNIVKKSYPAQKDSRELPLVSIITAVWNGEKYLEDTIEHVLQQTYDNIEYIIIDGASTDKTLDIIRKYDDAIDYWVSEPDKGIYDAMNKGISFASGEIIGLINSDDYYDTRTIEKVVEAYLENKNGKIFYGDIVFWNNNVGIKKRVPPRFDMIKYANRMNHPACFIHKDVYKEKTYSLEYDLLADYDLLLYAYLQKMEFVYINYPLATQRAGGASDRLFIFQDFRIKVKYFGYLYAIRTNWPRQFIRIAETAFKKVVSFIFNENVAFKIQYRVRKMLGREMPNRK